MPYRDHAPISVALLDAVLSDRAQYIIEIQSPLLMDIEKAVVEQYRGYNARRMPVNAPEAGYSTWEITDEKYRQRAVRAAQEAIRLAELLAEA